jgi:hypothetical protein
MILSICLFDFIMDRYDIFPTIMCLAALYFIRFDKIEWAWVMIALGTVTKLYPALMAPVLLIHLCMKGRKMDALKGAGICLIIGCMSMLPFFITDPESSLMFLTYHMDRGMQVEALASSFLMLFGHFDLFDVGYAFNFGSDNIYGPIPDAVASLMLPLMSIALLTTYIVYWYILRKKLYTDDYRPLVATCLAAIMLFMLFNKVLSSQYLVWMIPFVTIVVIGLKPEWNSSAICAFAISIALTQINLIVNYALRPVGEPFTLGGICLLMVRNVALVLLLALVFRTISGSGYLVSDREI